ncbi:MAG TPA: hypothetical protein VGC37_08635 [Friedmanniella sp.]
MSTPTPGGRPPEQTHHGFLPGELIHLAVIVASRPASADGTVAVPIPPLGTRVVLFGASSGTLVQVGP